MPNVRLKLNDVMRFFALLSIFLFPSLIISQNFEEDEVAKVYISILYQIDHNPVKLVIRETTSYYNLENSIDNFKENQYSRFFSDPPINNIYFALFDKYKCCTEKLKKINFIIKQDSAQNIDILTDNEYKEIFDSKRYHSLRQEYGYKEFNKRFPESYGYYCFSWPVFSDDKKIAICYMESNSSIKSGYGKLIFLEKVNYEWEIRYLIDLWIS